jgi:hypothetical protein
MDLSNWNISVCGLNCAQCGLFKSKKCEGCRGPLDHHWSPNCRMQNCALIRGYDYCFECIDFPCEHVTAFANDGQPHHKITVENMKHMKALGLQAWIESQPAVLFCPGQISDK